MNRCCCSVCLVWSANLLKGSLFQHYQGNSSRKRKCTGNLPAFVSSSRMLGVKGAQVSLHVENSCAHLENNLFRKNLNNYWINVDKSRVSTAVKSAKFSRRDVDHSTLPRRRIQCKNLTKHRIAFLSATDSHFFQLRSGVSAEK